MKATAIRACVVYQLSHAPRTAKRRSGIGSSAARTGTDLVDRLRPTPKRLNIRPYLRSVSDDDPAADPRSLGHADRYRPRRRVELPELLDLNDLLRGRCGTERTLVEVRDEATDAADKPPDGPRWAREPLDPAAIAAAVRQADRREPIRHGRLGSVPGGAGGGITKIVVGGWCSVGSWLSAVSSALNNVTENTEIDQHRHQTRKTHEERNAHQRPPAGGVPHRHRRGRGCSKNSTSSVPAKRATSATSTRAGSSTSSRAIQAAFVDFGIGRNGFCTSRTWTRRTTSTCSRSDLAEYEAEMDREYGGGSGRDRDRGGAVGEIVTVIVPLCA